MNIVKNDLFEIMNNQIKQISFFIRFVCVYIRLPDTFFLERLSVMLMLTFDKSSHSASVSTTVEIDRNYWAIDHQNEDTTKNDHEVCFCTSVEHVDCTSQVVWESIVRNPHIGDIEGQREENDHYEKHSWPKFSMSR